MKLPFIRRASIAGFALALAASAAVAQDPAPSPRAMSLAELKAGFDHPPASSRPMVRWWWFGTAVEKPEILRELQQMKAGGIGGAELAFVYPEVLNDPSKGLENYPFLSPPMLDAVRYAQAEARKLGLRIDVTLCSGWPYGGPATTLALAAGRLRTAEVAVPPNATSAATPTLKEGETLLSAALVDGTPTPARTEPSWSPASARPYTPGTAIPLATQPRLALFFIQSHTGQQVKRAAVGAEGYVLDPFSHEAVANHLRAVGEPLLSAFGATPPHAIFSDSLEAYGADWTPALPAEFRKRRGYDLLPRLPELVAGGTPAAENLRHDYGQTLTELVNENYLTQIDTWATTHHTLFRSQTYGEPAVSFSSQKLVALAEGEGPQWRAFSTLRWASSANHVFHRAITSGETFTWLHSPVFRATPLDMKVESDIDFIMGENQLIFHGWPYSPPPGKVPEPGWSLYAAASFNDHNPWHPVLPAVTDYIARLSFLMRQGEPANQVAILLPTDDAWAGFTPAHVTITGAMSKLVPPALMAAVLSAGYNTDFIDAAAIDSVGLGTHRLIVLPPTDRIPLEALKQLAAFTSRGGHVVAVGHLPTLTAEGQPLATPPAFITLVPDASQLAKALHAAQLPDLQLAPTADTNTRNQIGFIRRHLPSADLYFVVNTSNQPLDTSVTFGSSHTFTQQWDPDTTASTAAAAVNQPLHLAPYESRVFVLSDAPARPAAAPATRRDLADLSADWTVTFTGLGSTKKEPALADWADDPATLHYSGEAIYTRNVTLTALPAGPVFLRVEGGQPLPGAPNQDGQEHASLGTDGLPNPLITRTGPGMHAYFDPPVHEAALILLNGRPAGALWHPPYRLDVSSLLKPGTNHIEIRVYNTALNAWSSLPPHDYGPLKAKYGDRFQMQDMDKVRSIASGLLGTIHLVTESVQ